MKTRRHHNNNGNRQKKTGSHLGRLQRLARSLGLSIVPRGINEPQEIRGSNGTAAHKSGGSK